MGELFALLSSMLFAFSGVLAKRGTGSGSGDNGTFVSLLQTFLICGLIFIYIYHYWGPIPITKKGIMWLVMGGILSSFLGRFYQYASVQRLGSVRAMGVKNLTPIFSVSLGVLLLGESLTITFMIGIFFIFTGLYMMVRQSLNINRGSEPAAAKTEGKVTLGSMIREKTKHLSFNRRVLLNNGYTFGAVSAFSYSLGLVVRKMGLNEIADPFFGATVGGLVGIFIYFGLACFKNQYRMAIKTTFTQFNGFLLLSGFSITAGQVFNFMAVSYTDVSRAGLLFTTQSIFAIILSRWFVKTNEHITWYTLLTIGVMITGTVIIVLE